MTPKVSVIVLTYNQEKLIGRTLDSIIAQECDFPFEIIVGEDCSTDGTLTVCREYEARYPGIIRLFANNPNKGLLDNYYDCLLEAKGEYIADCGGDDFWIDPLKLKKEADILDSDPGITIVHTAWQYYDEPTGTVSPSHTEEYHSKHLKPISPKGELFLPILTDTHAPLIHLCTAMYRRYAIMKCYNADTRLFRDKQFLCEDLQLTSSLSRDGKVAYIPDVTLSYSIGKPSVLSRGNLEKTWLFHTSTLKLLEYIRQQNDIPYSALATKYSDKLYYVLTQAFRLQDREKIDDTLELYKTTGTPKSIKARALEVLSSNDIVWKNALRLLKSLKPDGNE